MLGTLPNEADEERRGVGRIIVVVVITIDVLLSFALGSVTCLLGHPGGWLVVGHYIGLAWALELELGVCLDRHGTSWGICMWLGGLWWSWGIVLAHEVQCRFAEGSMNEGCFLDSVNNT